MQIIQFFLIVAVVLAAGFAMRFLPGDRSLALKRLFALVFVVVAALAIIFPSALTRVAGFFGVGRGTDLLLYILVVMTLLFAVATIRAKARSDARVTEVARAVALMDARERERNAADDGIGSEPGTSS